MESSLDTELDQIIVTLSHSECLEIAEPGAVITGPSPLGKQAMLEIRPIMDFDPSYEPLRPGQSGFASRLGEVACHVQVLDTRDVRVFIPPEIVRVTYFAAEEVIAQDIEGDRVIVPKGGARIEFGEVVGKNNRKHAAARRAEDAETAAREAQEA